MRRTTIPVQNLFAWGKLNGVDFNHVDIEANITSIDGSSKGAGLVTQSRHGAKVGGTVLLSVPHELVLSQGQVQRYASLDRNLRLVLDAAGGFGRVRVWSSAVPLL